MKDIKQIIGQSGASGLPNRSWTSKTSTGDSPTGGRQDPISSETKALINLIFARFTAIYGHKFKSVFQTEDEIRIAKREWALSMQGYSEQELVDAVGRCKKTYAWMPTIAEFLGAMKKDPTDYGLPSVQAAYEEACQRSDHPREQHWSHPAVYTAGRVTGWFRLRTEEKRQVFRDFESAYRQLCDRVIKGELFDIPQPKALPDHSSNTLVDFIASWGEAHQLSAEQASTLLYYLFKPKGSPVRARLKQVSERRARECGLLVELPEDYR